MPDQWTARSAVLCGAVGRSTHPHPSENGRVLHETLTPEAREALNGMDRLLCGRLVGNVLARRPQFIREKSRSGAEAAAVAACAFVYAMYVCIFGIVLNIALVALPDGAKAVVWLPVIAFAACLVLALWKLIRFFALARRWRELASTSRSS